MGNVMQESQLQALFNCTKKSDDCMLTGNILVLSDRLSAVAIELCKYIEAHTDAKVLGLISTRKQLEAINGNKVDYLIIAGYLEEKESYSIIETLRAKNDCLKTVQWSILDAYIRNLGLQYRIKFQFDRFRPLSQFISYLYQIKDLYDLDAIFKKHMVDIYVFIKEKIETARYTRNRIILQMENADISLCKKTYATIEHPYDKIRTIITKMAIKEYLQNRRSVFYINEKEKYNTFSLLQQEIIDATMTIEEMNQYYTAILTILHKIDAFIAPIIKTK